MNKLLYDIKDLTEILPFADKTIRNMIAEDKLPMWKIGGKWVISQDKLRKWIESSEYAGIL